MLANAVPERALELAFAALQLVFAWQLAKKSGTPLGCKPVEILEVSTEDRNGLVHVALVGELDLSSVPKVQEELRRVEAGVAAPRSCSTSRSSASSTPRGCAASSPPTSARARPGRRVVIVRGPDPVQRVFSITRLEERLEMVDDAAAIS